jgi:hypothetical protein
LRTAPARVAAHVAITGIVDEDAVEDECAGFDVRRSGVRKQRLGRILLATTRIELEEHATGRRHDFAVGTIHFGGVDFFCALQPYPGGARFEEAVARLWEKLPTASLSELLRTTAAEFGPEEHDLRSVLDDGRRRIAHLAFGELVKRFAAEYTRMYEANERTLEMLEEAGFELPEELRAAAQFAFARRFDDAMRGAAGSRDPEAYAEAVKVAEEAQRRGFAFDRAAMAGPFCELVAAVVATAIEHQTPGNLAAAKALADVARRLGLAGELGRAQELLSDALAAGAAADATLHPLAVALDLAVPGRSG